MATPPEQHPPLRDARDNGESGEAEGKERPAGSQMAIEAQSLSQVNTVHEERHRDQAAPQSHPRGADQARQDASKAAQDHLLRLVFR